MLRTAPILFCDLCEAAAANVKRGWRAYIEPEGCHGERRVTVVCPACAERNYGEDEAAWSD